MTHLDESNLIEYGSWDEAVLNSKGYEDPKLIEFFKKQFKSSIENRLAQSGDVGTSAISERELHIRLAWLSTVGKFSEVKCADIGGGNGYMADWISRMALRQNVSWNVLDSPMIVNAYSSEGAGLGINFVNLTIESMSEQYDIAIISGTLQYLKNWEQVLEKIGSNSKFVVLMRTPFTIESEDRYFVQKTVYGDVVASIPHIFFSKSKFEEKLNRFFVKLYSVDEHSESFMWKGGKFNMMGYVLESIAR